MGVGREENVGDVVETNEFRNTRRVFKYYGLPKWKVVEQCRILGKRGYHERDSQGERQSCNKIRN